ncbi:MAG: Helicase associated domain protein [Eubacteriales bacterium]|nr:Helicase associated domain protein [Eubacteriales bacterium]
MKPIQLYPHNQSAYENLISMLERENRGAVIQPTGTGKSFIALKLIQENPKSTFLYLAPSVYIFQQLRHHADDPLDGTYMLTYQRLCRMGADEIMELKADYIILDEFHRCGADEWGDAVRILLSNSEQAVLVGFTATPIRYLDQAGVRDMAEELFGACIANYYSLRQAIADGVLPAPQYVLCDILMSTKLEVRTAMYHQHINNGQVYEAERLLEDMRRNLAQAIGVEAIFAQYLPSAHAKLIVFCRNLDHISQAQADLLHWLRAFGPARCYSCRSDDIEANTELLAFIHDTKEDAIRLLFCVDMLNEGLHIRDVDGVVMLRPTVSPTVYLQQIGRCLSSSPNSNTHPVIFDLVNNHRSAKVEGSDDILFHANMGSISKRVRKMRDSRPFVLDSRLEEFDMLLGKFDHMFERNGRWTYLFSTLQDYVQQYGVYPKHREYYRGIAIGGWLTHQIRFLESGILPVERASALAQLPGWEDYLVVRPTNRGTQIRERRRWFASLARLKNYLQEHDGQYPDANAGKDLVIYYWCHYYGRRYQRNAIPQEMKAALDELPGWADYIEKKRRIQRHTLRGHTPPQSLLAVAEMLTKYTAEHNGQNPPQNTVIDGVRLGKRIDRYRQAKKKGKLPLESQQILEAAGIIWVLRQKAKPRSFDCYYEELCRYKAREGHLLVPQSYINPETQCKLGLFVHRMRLARKGKHGYYITPEQIQKLDALGMVWNVVTRRKTE